MLDFCLLSIIGCGLIGAALAAFGVVREIQKARTNFDDDRTGHA